MTNTHVYFLSGPLSQWTRSPFRGRLEEGGEIFAFTCAEQYMMAGKAHLFGDREALVAILRSDEPKEQKDLGHTVRGFEPAQWAEACEDIVIRGNLYKFSQNKELAEYFVGTDNRTLVEGNPRDLVWGVGLAWDDPRIEDLKNWRGSNLLGKSLETVRPIIRAHRERGGRINPWTRTIITKPSLADGRV